MSEIERAARKVVRYWEDDSLIDLAFDELRDAVNAPSAPGPPMADLAPGARIVLATVGVGVPTEHAGRLTQAVADAAVRLGYHSVIAEDDHVSGISTTSNHRRDTAQTCPGCHRKISRYPGGKFYKHDCTPVATS